MATLTSYASEIQNVFQLLGYPLTVIVIGEMQAYSVGLLLSIENASSSGYDLRSQIRNLALSL
jgi:hypothetical protein